MKYIVLQHLGVLDFSRIEKTEEREKEKNEASNVDVWLVERWMRDKLPVCI